MFDTFDQRPYPSGWFGFSWSFRFWFLEKNCHPSLPATPPTPLPAGAGQVERVIATAAETFGKIDGVANCVGSIVLKGAHQTSDDEFNKTIALNLNSAFYVLR